MVHNERLMKVKVFIPSESKDIKELFGIAANDNSSKQLLETNFNYAGDKAVEPPYAIDPFCSIFETSSMVHACIEAYKQNILGFGWEVVFIEGVDEKDKEAKAQKEKLERLLDSPNQEITSGQILFNQYTIDKETTGQGYIEVPRSKNGDISGLWNAPSRTIRIRAKTFDQKLQRKMPNGFVQSIDLKKIFFKNFGDERGMNRSTGEYSKERLPSNQETNELLMSKVYAPRSPYYGIPRYVSSGMAITGTYWAERTDNAYFKNGCFIGKMMVVTNAKLDKDSLAEITTYMQNMKGNPDNAHKMMIVSLEPESDEESQDLSRKEKKSDVKFESLSDKNELGFKEYYETSDKIIKRAFRLPDIFLGENREISRANYWTARAFAEEQVFHPLRLEEEGFFNQTIVKKFNLYNPDAMNKVKLKFLKLPTGDSKEQAEEDFFAVRAGSRTVNEMRDRDGKATIEAWWADVPQEIAKIMLQAGYPPTGKLDEILKNMKESGKSLVLFNKDGSGTDRFVKIESLETFIEGIVELRKSVQKEIDIKTGGE